MRSEGEVRKNIGLDRVSTNNSEWIIAMRKFAQSVAAERGYVCADDLRDYANKLAKKGSVPTHSNAWGGIFRDKMFIRAGYILSQYPGNHARLIGLWKVV